MTLPVFTFSVCIWTVWQVQLSDCLSCMYFSSLSRLFLSLHFFVFCSSLLLGFGELGLESLLCWEKTVTCQYRNQPYDFWSLLNSTSHKHRGKKGMCSDMFWYKNKKLVDLQTFAIFYISNTFRLLSLSALRQNNNNVVLCKSHNFITAGERATTMHF